MSGAAIEAASFAAIDKEAGVHGFSADQWEVVRRMIHTTADFSLAQSVKFSSDAIEAAVAALARASLHLRRFAHDPCGDFAGSPALGQSDLHTR
jgi:precorrin isomerase